MNIDQEKMADWWARAYACRNPFTGEDDWPDDVTYGAYQVLDKILPQEAKDAAEDRFISQLQDRD